MQIIPVIDIKDGLVVHAIKGQRDSYKPVQSKICKDSSPGNVINAFLDIYPFKIFYIADLNAISGSGNNNMIINEIYNTYSDTTFWLDTGKSSLDKIDNFITNNIINVFGTETGITNENLQQIKLKLPDSILSLDFFAGRLTGDISIINHIDSWLNNIIIMCLDRVGTKASPDFQHISSIQSLAPEKKFFAAGGIGHKSDLQILKSKGISGALLATALHSGSISVDDLAEIIET